LYFSQRLLYWLTFKDRFERSWSRLFLKRCVCIAFDMCDWYYSVLLMEEIRVSAKNHRPVASHWQTSSHNAVSSTPRLGGIRTHNGRYLKEK
jgi:hypothetical protein